MLFAIKCGAAVAVIVPAFAAFSVVWVLYTNVWDRYNSFVPQR